MQLFTKTVIEVIQSIPFGRVATYGQVARLAGNPRAARQVSRILHSMSAKYNLPWHRVVNAKGEIVIADSETAYQQRILLENENVLLINGKRVDLESERWNPDRLDEETL